MASKQRIETFDTRASASPTRRAIPEQGWYWYDAAHKPAYQGEAIPLRGPFASEADAIEDARRF